jgi:NADPH:quinone reductase-like Zn-dependent oxidoreductase
MATGELPQTHRALVQHVYAEPLKVETIPTPQPTPGSAIIRVLATPVISYMKNIYNGTRKYSYPTPLVVGTSAIGRVAAVGPDAVHLKPGQLVFFDCTIRARDDPGAIILSGIADGSSEASKKLMAGEWRNSSYQEYMKTPLENTFPLNESLLCGKPEGGGYGYSLESIAHVCGLLVPFGGLRDVRLEAGETIIIAPATGQFGGAAVKVALAMGAKVIAMGRNEQVLASLKSLSKRVETVRITGNHEEEVAALQRYGPADVYFDISPREAINSSHFMSALLSLGHGARISYMGGLLENVPIPMRLLMRKDFKLHGKWMYSANDVKLLLKMIEIGILSLADDLASVTARYPLEQWQEAFDTAAANAASGQLTVFNP